MGVPNNLCRWPNLNLLLGNNIFLVSDLLVPYVGPEIKSRQDDTCPNKPMHSPLLENKLGISLA